MRVVEETGKSEQQMDMAPLRIPPIRAAILLAVGFVVFVSISTILLIGDEHAISHHNHHNSNGALGTIRRRLSEIDPFVEKSEL